MMPLNHILRKCTAGYKLSRLQEKINHLMYMDDIKLFAKNKGELETLIQTVRIYSQDIGMEFWIEKCIMLVTKIGKRHSQKESNKQINNKIRILEEKETYRYLVTLEFDTTSQLGMKEKTKKEYLRRTRKLLETKLYSRILIKVVHLTRYSGHFLKWSREELKQMCQRTRKLMTMYKALHPRYDVDRLYVSRKERGIELASIEKRVEASRQRREDYIEKHRRRLITATGKNTDESRTSKPEITRKQK